MAGAEQVRGLAVGSENPKHRHYMIRLKSVWSPVEKRLEGGLVAVTA